jgi:uncharacterized protein
MYGPSDFSFRSSSGDISLSFERLPAYTVYRRSCREDQAEKIIGAQEGTVLLNPVEPLNLPKEITRFYEVHFRPVFVGPGSGIVLYLTFPIEIGVFLLARDGYDLLDIFSLSKPKYSLYGDPDTGILTRWHESRVHAERPETDPLREGIMELSIRNMSGTWVEVTRAVFEKTGMDIYYGKYVSVSARMDVYSEIVAETRILSTPPDPGMMKSVPAFSAKKVSVVEMVNQIPFYSSKRAFVPEKGGFLMEQGLGDGLADD